MGHGNYSHAAHEALIADRSNRSSSEVFHQGGCHALMNPHGLKVREARDSADHPNSLGIIFALDVTGSMGAIPELLARQELPTFMKLLTACKVADPQLLFMAIGDANSDRAALQVGQFESTAELMDQWLTRCFIERGGGGSGEESYELAFYVAAQHTDMDCWTKRRKRGYLFLTGDELPYEKVSRHQIGTLIGENLDEDIPIEEVIAAASESFHIFYLIPDLARRKRCESRWRKLLGDHVICMESPEDTCAVAAALVALTEKVLPDISAAAAALSANGLAPERTSSVVRALRSYAEPLDPASVSRVNAQAAASPTGKPHWWKKVFG